MNNGYWHVTNEGEVLREEYGGIIQSVRPLSDNRVEILLPGFPRLFGKASMEVHTISNSFVEKVQAKKFACQIIRRNIARLEEYLARLEREINEEGR